MKTTFRNFVFGLLLISVLSACQTASRLAGGTHTARIQALESGAEISRAGGPWEQARLWQKLRAGDRARTAAHGTIDFTLGKFGGVLTLMPDSTIEFQQIGPAESEPSIVAVLSLTAGRIVGDTLDLPSGVRIRIKTLGGVYEIP